MKKIICMFLIICVFVSSVYASDSDIGEALPQLYVDGLRIYSLYKAEHMERDGVLYAPVRSVFEVLGYMTVWNDKTQTVILYAGDSSGKAGLKIDSNKMYTYINGEHEIHILPHNVIMENNLTYIPVINVCEAMGFEVRTDAESGIVSVTTYDFEDYAYDEWIKYGFAEEEHITDGFITHKDVIRYFTRRRTEVDEEIEAWYRYEDFEPFNNADDELKGRIMCLIYDKLINDEEVISTDFDARLTQYEALRYAIRCAPDWGGCIFDFDEYYYSDKESVYRSAFSKGLIDSIDYSKADEPVSAKDFLNLIYRTKFILHHTGGFGRAELVRDIDYLKKTQNVNDGK